MINKKELNAWWSTLTLSQRIAVRKRYEHGNKSTAERNVLKNIANAGGKWKLCYGEIYSPKHNAPKRIAEVFIKIKGKYYRGFANCSPNDIYYKHLARTIALGRAWKAYENSKPTPIDDVPDELLFGEDKRNIDVKK